MTPQHILDGGCSDFARGSAFAGGCRLCWLAYHDPGYRESWELPGPPPGSGFVASRPRRPLPCVHLGPQVNPVPGCQTCRADHRCDAGRGPVKPGVECQTCPEYDADGEDLDAPAEPKQPPPLAVISIGHWEMPSAVELNLKLIRRHCGDVPVLVNDDSSREPWASDVERIATAYGARFVTAGPYRLGHVGGDLGAYWHGLNLCRELGARVLCKLSMRMMIDVPNWLETEARGLLRANAAAASQHCDYGTKTHFRLRTEFMVLDAQQWCRPDVLECLRPRRPDPPYPAEQILWDALVRLNGGAIAGLRSVGPDRLRQYPGTVWHDAAGAADEYARLFEREGLTPCDRFHSKWSTQLKDGSRNPAYFF